MRLRSVSNDEWAELAKRLPLGQKRRTFHQCQTRLNKTSFEYGRDKEGSVWCKCHRCGYSDRQKLGGAVYIAPAEEQVKVPHDVVPITEVLAKHPGLMRTALSMNELLPHLSQLKASPTYGRIYLPDESGSYCGLDYTGKQFIPWRSPFKHNMALTISNQSEVFWVLDDAAQYVSSVRTGQDAAFVSNADSTTLSALVGVLLACQYKIIYIDHQQANALRKELRLCAEVRVIGGS